ncbi:MAG: hypothetical protein DWQ34_07795 [Planctomycetota bacterium]|nr:MAG: hypothetical protein DWQ34_07795 [Planctomycetota bacterium]
MHFSVSLTLDHAVNAKPSPPKLLFSMGVAFLVFATFCVALGLLGVGEMKGDKATFLVACAVPAALAAFYGVKTTRSALSRMKEGPSPPSAVSLALIALLTVCVLMLFVGAVLLLAWPQAGPR